MGSPAVHLTNMMMDLWSFSLTFLVIFSLNFALPSAQLKIPFPRRGTPPNSKGDYSFSFSSSEQKARQSRQESGFGSASEKVEGSYSFTSPEGQQVAISYTADKNGYFPRGTGIHPALLRALEHLRKVNGI